MGIVTLNHLIVQKLLVLNKNTWTNNTTLCKQMIIENKVQLKKQKI